MKPFPYISWPLTLDSETAEALYDDCPVCQELKRQLEHGELKGISVEIDLEEDEAN